MKAELLIAGESGTEIYIPAVEDGIEWSTERWGVPGRLTFKVLADHILNFSEGSAVRLQVDDAKIFLVLYLPRRGIRRIGYQSQRMISYGI